MSTQHALIVETRRSKVLEYHATNKTQREIASLLNVSVTTVNKDLQWIKQQAENNIKGHMTNLAHQYARTCAALDVITKRAFEEAELAKYVKDKHALLTLARDTVKIRWELSTDASVIEEAMSFVEVTNRQVKHSDNSLSEIIEEQPTNQQLPNEELLPNDSNRKIICEEPEDSIVVAAEQEIDREIEAIDRRMNKEANESEMYASRTIQPETKGTNADTALIKPVNRTPIKKFTAEPEVKAPLDLTTSELQLQQREQEAANQQAREDAIKFKPSHEIVDVDNTWSNAKKRIYLRE